MVKVALIMLCYIRVVIKVVGVSHICDQTVHVTVVATTVNITVT